MKIAVFPPVPPLADLVQVLNDAFGPTYSFRIFGMGKNKTIMARKSALVGLQLSVDGNEIHFQPTPPTATGSALGFMMLTELASLVMIPVLVITGFFRRDPYKEMAKSDAGESEAETSPSHAHGVRALRALGTNAEV